MHKRTKTILTILLLLALTVLLTGAVLAEDDTPESVDALDAQQVDKSHDHANVMADLNRSGRVRLIVRLATPADFVGVNGLSGAEEAAEMAKIDRAQADFTRRFPDLNEGMVAFDYIPYVSIWINNEAQYAALLANPMVEAAFQDVPVPAHELDAAPAAMAEAAPWVNADEAWALGHTGAGYYVAILDTGVDKNHGYLSGKVYSEACYSTNDSYYESTSICPGGVTASTAVNSAMPYAGSCPAGACDHGTHVAAIAAGAYTGFYGVAPDAAIIAIQVFSRFETDAYCGAGNSPCVLSWPTDQMLGLERVYALRTTFTTIAAANMSLGGDKYDNYCDTDPRKPAIDNLAAADIATVISAGNDGYKDSVGAPGCISTAYTVGATGDTNDSVATFSNAHPDILDFWAPGVNITSAIPGSGNPTETWNGTSMAAPMVTGGFVLLKQGHPGLNLDQLWAVMSTAGTTVTDTRSGGTTVAPRLDFAAAFTAPSTPVHTSPASSSNVSSVTPTFYWEDLDYATRFTFEIQRSDNSSVVLKQTYEAADLCEAGVCSLTSPISLTDGVTYKWHVQALNGTVGGSWSGWWTFTINLTALEPVTLRSPGVDAAVYGGRPTFKWYPQGAATVYDVEMFDSAMVSMGYWNKGVGACDPGPYCEHRIPFDLGSAYGDYYWAVRARNTSTGDDGGWSETRKFTYTALERTWQISPADGYVSSSPTPTLQWGPITGATMYLMQFRLPDDTFVFNVLVPHDTYCDATACTWDVDPALANGDYKWHVRAKNGRNFGRWTAYRAITITGGASTWNYDFNSSAADWIDLDDVWDIWSSAAYRGQPGVCDYNCATTYHNYNLTNGTFEARLRSVGENGPDGFSILVNAKFDAGGLETQFYSFDFQHDGTNLYVYAWVYQSGSGLEYFGAINLGNDIVFSNYQTYKVVVDPSAAEELVLYINNVPVASIEELVFYDGAFGVDVIKLSDGGHSVDMDWAIITGVLPGEPPAGFGSPTIHGFSAFGLNPDGSRIVTGEESDPARRLQVFE
jgi:subtilisin family serine protease